VPAAEAQADLGGHRRRQRDGGRGPLEGGGQRVGGRGVGDGGLEVGEQPVVEAIAGGHGAERGLDRVVPLAEAGRQADRAAHRGRVAGLAGEHGEERCERAGGVAELLVEDRGVAEAQAGGLAGVVGERADGGGVGGRRGGPVLGAGGQLGDLALDHAVAGRQREGLGEVGEGAGGVARVL
jgi:hypothetical protein